MKKAVYVFTYAIAEICVNFGCSRVTASKLLAKRDMQNVIGLIERKRQGIGKTILD